MRSTRTSAPARGSRPGQAGGRTADGGKPGARKPGTGKPRAGGPRSGKPATGKPRSFKPATGKPASRRAPRIAPLSGPNAFVDLGVPTGLAAVLAHHDITEPTDIQRATIPDALRGRDVLGRGRTGSGKTLAFGLPLIALLAATRSAPARPRGLVLAPTRELAMQVLDALRPLTDAAGLKLVLIMGGGSYDKQLAGLQRADIVIATPGRLIDLLDRGALRLSDVQITVLDEADQMADLGFMDEVDAILTRIDRRGQTLLFSATLDHQVQRLVDAYLVDPVEHATDPGTATIDTMAHHVLLVHPKDKDAVTRAIAGRRGRTVAFVRTQLGAESLAEDLAGLGIRTASLHGGKAQGARTRALRSLREGAVDLLVATDVAARGIHVDGIDMVVHVDPPMGHKEYLHRSGRTARAGATGTVVTVATLRQQRSVAALIKRAGVEPTWVRARPGSPELAQYC